MALKKSQLYSSLWQSCDELRGGMDASQYKDYVLTLLFMKYVSDKYAGKPNPLLEVPKGGGFADMVALKGDKEIGDKINKIIGRLAEANDLKGVIDQADFNDEGKLGSGKEMQDRLSKLVAIFDGLDFRANRAEGDDLLGDAYEYLMRHFATESGKSKGQFYTPAEVSRIMAQVVGIGPDTRQDQTIYDPTCGSGSLLLKAADEAPRGITVYGQEMDVATWALARMNMILHGHPTAELWRGNTLASPYFKNKDGALKTFDFAVANPPFSSKAWSSGLDPANDEFGRFAYGIPPAKNGDYAFLLHLVASLKSKGKGAIILPHGVLFRGNKEADIRRALIQRGLIKGIIGLPANLFYGTGIPACIVVVDKEHAGECRDPETGGIFMIDGSKGFLKDGNKNRLRSQDIHKIVDVFNHQRDLPRYARRVPLAEIASPANDYNLNIPRYIDSSEPEDLHDLDAHLNGGIPDRDIDSLSAYWDVFPSLRKVLFADAQELDATPLEGMSPTYFETHFRQDGSGELTDEWPERFAIVTAWATTGEVWTDAQNQGADERLQNELQHRTLWHRRLTGFSPGTGPRRTCWAVDLDPNAACDLGQQFQQDAIYYVERDDLTVSYCDERRDRIPVGSFRARLRHNDGQPVVRTGYSVARVDARQIKTTILEHPQFEAYAGRIAAVFEAWRKAHEPQLTGLKIDELPKTVIHTLSEELLARFANLPLLSRYDVYQRLMDYWAETLQDDVYLIAADGWEAGRVLREAYDKEIPDLSIKHGRKNRKYVGQLIPSKLIIARCFADEQDEVDRLESEVTTATERREEFEEEHGSDEGALNGLEGKSGITKGNVQQRAIDLKQVILDSYDKNSSQYKQAKTIKKTTFGSGRWESGVKDDEGLFEELDILYEHLQIASGESAQKNAHKDAVKKLHKQVLAKYPKLTEAEIKTLVVEDKWLASIRAAIEGEVERLPQRLAARVKELGERYAKPLPALEEDVEAFSAKVEGHLKKMGLAWG
jgi:type I restriction system adenine methylase HsdM